MPANEYWADGRRKRAVTVTTDTRESRSETAEKLVGSLNSRARRKLKRRLAREQRKVNGLD
jgi:hypothetical protein